MTGMNKPKALLIILIAIIWQPFTAAPVHAESDGVAADFETITPGNTPTGFSVSKIAPVKDARAGLRAQAALVSVETNSITFCINGIAPTQTSGSAVCHRMDAGQSYMVRGEENVAKFLCIDRVSGNTATVRATYFFER